MKIKSFFPFVLMLCLVSCREEVITSDNPSGNINEPYLTRTADSYTFYILADRMTSTISDHTFLKTVRSRIFSVIKEYASGSVIIKIQTTGSSTIYSKLFNQNTVGSFSEIAGQQPDIITFTFNNFSGELQVTLTDTE